MLQPDWTAANEGRVNIERVCSVFQYFLDLEV